MHYLKRRGCPFSSRQKRDFSMYYRVKLKLILIMKDVISMMKIITMLMIMVMKMTKKQTYTMAF